MSPQWSCTTKKPPEDGRYAWGSVVVYVAAVETVDVEHHRSQDLYYHAQRKPDPRPSPVKPPHERPPITPPRHRFPPPPRPNRLAQSTKRNTTTTTNVIFTPGPHRACQCPLLIIILVAVFLLLCLSLFRHCLLIISFAIAQTLQSPSPLVFNYHNCFFSNSQEPLKKHSQHRTRMAKVSERSLDLPWSFSHNTAPRLALLCSFHGDVHINCLTVKH